jgi:hypothetical protein
MDKNDELTIELAKNKADEFVVKKELEIAKRDFINSLQNGFGEEIKTTNNSYYIKPIRIKKPFKYKVRDFFNNISKVFGF